MKRWWGKQEAFCIVLPQSPSTIVNPLYSKISSIICLLDKKNYNEKESRGKRLKLREKRLFYFSFLKLTLIALSDRSISPEYRSFLTLFELRTGSFVLRNTKLIQSWINRWQRVHCQLDHRDWISQKPVLIVEKTCLQFLARVILRQVCTRCMRMWIARRLNRPSNAFFFLFFFDLLIEMDESRWDRLTLSRCAFSIFTKRFRIKITTLLLPYTLNKW